MTIKINKDLALLEYLPDPFLLKAWRPPPRSDSGAAEVITVQARGRCVL